MFSVWFTRERRRLGRRRDVAALLGVTENRLKQVEAGSVTPDTVFLARCAQAGMDTNYILTGRGLRPAGQEAGLLSRFCHAPAAVRAAVMAMLALYAEPALAGAAPGAPECCLQAPAAPTHIHIHGNGSNLIAVQGGRILRKG